MAASPSLTIYRLHSARYAATDTTGALLQAGRWHSRGSRVLYAAEHISLAVLETLVHASGGALPPKSLTRIDIPASVAIESATWMDIPGSRTFGEQWLAEGRSAVLRVPSIVVNQLENNFVLNPAHPDFAAITFTHSQPFAIDPRFVALS